MSSEAHSISLVAPVVLLAAAVIAVPIFKRIGLGSVLGYLIAGLIIGPFGFAFFSRFHRNFAYCRVGNCDVPLCDWFGNATLTFVES